jgi:hypothetical protein
LLEKRISKMSVIRPRGARSFVLSSVVFVALSVVLPVTASAANVTALDSMAAQQASQSIDALQPVRRIRSEAAFPAGPRCLRAVNQNNFGLASCANVLDRQWALVDAGGGTVLIRSMAPFPAGPRCLRAVNQNNVGPASCANVPDRRWTLVALIGGTVLIRSEAFPFPYRCLRAVNQNNFGLASCANVLDRRWRLI